MKRRRGRPRKTSNKDLKEDQTAGGGAGEEVIEVHLGINDDGSNLQVISDNGASISDGNRLDAEFLVESSDPNQLLPEGAEELSEMTTIVVTSDHNCSVDCLHLQYDQSQDEMLTSEQQCFDQTRTSELTVVADELDYSQLNLTPLKDDLKSKDGVEASFRTMTNVEPVAVDQSEVTALALTYSEADKQHFVQFQCNDGDKNQCGSLQLALDSPQDQHFTIIQTDENGKVKHVDCGPVILQVAALSDT